MSQELASSNASQVDFETLFSEARNIIETTRPEEGFLDQHMLLSVYENVKASFEEDYQRVEKYGSVLFGEDVDDYGAETTKIFTDWEETDSGPSSTAMVAHAIEQFDLDVSKPVVKAAFISSILAEYPNDLQYHGNEHYRKVLFHGIRMIQTHNNMFKDTNRAFTEPQISVLLAASCIHDLGHEGGDNLREGMYTPGKMEQRAFDIARPYYEAVDMPKDEMGETETIVFCTDITFFAGDNSPCIRMKKIFKHYFWDDTREDVSMMMMGKLRRFEDNPRLVLMAMLLHEADIATSAGLSYEQTIKETINIMEEREVTTPGPRTVLAFLREQLGETLFTEAGKRIFAPVMNDVIKHAEADIERGRQTFYED